MTPRKRLVNEVKIERDRHDRTLKVGEEFSKWRNWIDLARAAVGGVVLTRVGMRLVEDDVLTNEGGLVVLGAVLLIGVLVQTFRMEGRLTLFAPIFFVQGLAFGTIGWLPALLAWIGAWGLSPVLPSPAVFLAIFAGIAFCLGTLLGGDMERSLVLVLVALVPVVLSVLLKRRLTSSLNKKLKVVRESAADAERG